jgi:putative DNA primase/helicase
MTAALGHTEKVNKKSAAHIKIVKRTPPAGNEQASEGRLQHSSDDTTALAEPAAIAVRMDPLDWTSFPDQASGGGTPPTTIANVKHILDAAGIRVRYNALKKRTEIVIPGHRGTDENYDNVALAHALSLVAQCGLPTGQVPTFIAALSDANAYHPVPDWIGSKPWDGTDRLPAFYKTLTETGDYPHELKCTLMRKWLLSAVAAALLPGGFRSRGVLTIQGAQGLGKTQWVGSLVPDPLRRAFVKLDHHLDAYNKDSIIGATSHWICEIGELDSSIKKDVARIKGVLTRDSDKVRIPYARAESEFPRRTVFAATVNRSDFLVDDTGNSRWWTIPVVDVDYEHGIDMQQLFAQLACDFRKGDQWWLTPEEERQLEQQNRHHRTASAIAERLMSLLDMGRIGESGLPAMTSTQLLLELGYAQPTNPQARECGAFLREHLGEPRRIHGEMKWRVPLRPRRFDEGSTPEREDRPDEFG